jgi:hypothetical protein
MPDYQLIKKELEGIAVEDNPALVRQKSRDFYWYSPILKGQLDGVTADLVVTPKSQEEVIRTLKVAFAHGVPITPRGAGTGNYGQAMPLSGGIVLSLAAMDKIREIHTGRVICEPGIVIAQLDKQTKAHSGQELRFHPRRVRRRRFDHLGRSSRSRQYPEAACRYHGSRAARARPCWLGSAKSEPCLRDERYHHRNRDAAGARL